MQTIYDLAELRQALASCVNQRIGLVPTMGNLHAGHLSLVDEIRSQCDVLIMSIFVNPLQFGANEDFDRYPRTLMADIKQAQASGVDIIWVPDSDTMYPGGKITTQVTPHPVLANQLEGLNRPGHFSGMLTVVLKLFQQTRANVAIFGQKDYQQWCLIQQMVRDFDFPIDLIMAPISRENDGLARSSRNQYLTPAERQLAPQLNRALTTLVKHIQGLHESTDIEAACQQTTRQLLQIGFQSVDYVRCLPASLMVKSQHTTQKVLISAVRLEAVRLLDNQLFYMKNSG